MQSNPGPRLADVAGVRISAIGDLLHAGSDGVHAFFNVDDFCKAHRQISQFLQLAGNRLAGHLFQCVHGFKIIGDQNLISGKDVLIIDDICSKGDTVIHAAEALKACGANDIYFFVTHCENTILKNKVLENDLIKKVYTTNSIFNSRHKKIGVFEL